MKKIVKSCDGAHPIYGAYSLRGLHLIKLAYNPCVWTAGSN